MFKCTTGEQGKTLWIKANLHIKHVSHSTLLIWCVLVSLIPDQRGHTPDPVYSTLTLDLLAEQKHIKQTSSTLALTLQQRVDEGLGVQPCRQPDWRPHRMTRPTSPKHSCFSRAARQYSPFHILATYNPQWTHVPVQQRHRCLQLQAEQQPHPHTKRGVFSFHVWTSRVATFLTSQDEGLNYDISGSLQRWCFSFQIKVLLE